MNNKRIKKGFLTVEFVMICILVLLISGTYKVAYNYYNDVWIPAQVVAECRMAMMALNTGGIKSLFESMRGSKSYVCVVEEQKVSICGDNQKRGIFTKKAMTAIVEELKDSNLKVIPEEVNGKYMITLEF